MLLFALTMLVIGVLFLAMARQRQRTLGLPPGRVIAIDGKALERLERPLFDRDLGLVGKPDYLVRRRRQLIPVEVKSGVAPAEPHESHALQLAAYCALVEAAFGTRPTYGVIKYADHSFAVAYSPGLERRMRALVAAIQAEGEGAPARSHRERRRCRACGYQAGCEQRLD